MALQARAVTVAATATRIDTSDWGSEAVSVYNAGASTVYLGASGVTTASGYPLAAGQHLAADIVGSGELYGIVATGTVEVRVLEVGV